MLKMSISVMDLLNTLYRLYFLINSYSNQNLLPYRKMSTDTNTNLKRCKTK